VGTTTLLKLLPVTIMLSGMALVGSEGKAFVEKITTKVKVLMTGMEVVKIGEEIRFHFLSTGEVAGMGGEEDFQQFLRQNFTAYVGSRDPSIDMFENPYELDAEDMGRGESVATVRSRGPNGNFDECVLLNGERMTIDWDEVEAELRELQLDEMGKTEEGEDPLALLDDEDEKEEILEQFGPDDICVSLEFALRDTPFRPLSSAPQ
jgi:hypothetical protein